MGTVQRHKLMLILVLPLLCVLAISMLVKLKEWRYWELVPEYLPAEIVKLVRPEAKPTVTGSYLAGYVAQRRDNIAKAATYYERAMKAGNQSHPIVSQSAYKSLLLAGKAKEAVVLAKNFLEKDEESVSATLMVSVGLIKEKKYSQAKELLNNIVDVDSELLRLASVDMLIMPYLSGWASAGEGKLEEALASMEKNFGNYKIFYLFTQYQQGLMYEAAGKNEKAYQAYQNAIGKLTLPYHLVRHAGNLMERLGKRSEAAALYNEYHSKYNYSSVFEAELDRIQAQETPEPFPIDATYGVAETMLEASRVLMRGGYPIEALAYAQLALYLDPSHDEASLLLAQALEQLNNYEAAIEAYKRISQKSGFEQKARIAIAKNLFHMEKKKEAIELMLDIYSGNKEDIQVLLSLADLYRQDKQFDLASNYYEKAVKAMEENGQLTWSIYFAAGIANERAKNWEVAEGYLKKALELEPKRPEVLNYLGYSWVDRGVHIEKGKQMISEALEYASNDAHILDSMGWAYYISGEYEKAVGYLEMAVEEMPYDPVLNEHLGDIYWKLGREREAGFQWRRALDYPGDSMDVDADQLKKKLKEGL